MDAQAAIAIDDLWFSYDRAPVLEAVTLRVDPRDSVCVVGPNGGGKTTLLKLILGLLEPDRGRVRVLGEPPIRARGRVGYVPQHMHFDPLFPISVLDVVLMGRIEQGGILRERRLRPAAMEALEEVGMAGRLRSVFSELSGGERQRVLIARALFGEPEILLLDEPTAMVDLAVESRLMRTLKGLHERMAIVLVSHDLGFVSKLVNSVICVNRRVAVHPTSEISGRMIEEMYGSDVAMVRHDHRCAVEEHRHD